MTDTLAEVDRLTQSAQLCRPTPVRDRWGRYKRDPGGQWDWFYALDPTEREYIARRHMGGTLGPDDVATIAGTDIDSAMTQWLTAVRAARARVVDPFADDYDDASSYDDAMAITDFLGPDEVADLLGVKRNTIAQWRYRHLLPEPVGTLSSLPIWKRSEIIAWAKVTGRTIVERSEV